MASSTRFTLVHKVVHRKLTGDSSTWPPSQDLHLPPNSSIHRIVPISCKPECLLANLLAGWLAGYGSLTRRSPSELHPVKEKVDQPRKTKLIKLWCYLPNPSHCLSPNESLWLCWSWWGGPRCCYLMASSTRSTLVHKNVRQKLTGRFVNSFLATFLAPISRHLLDNSFATTTGFKLTTRLWK